MQYSTNKNIANKTKTYYEILGINNTAGVDDIKKAYKKLALEWHPDKNKSPDALNMFKEISNAYQILSDVGKRQEYDNSLVRGTKIEYNFREPSDIFKEFISMFAAIHNAMDMMGSFRNFGHDQIFHNLGPSIGIIEVIEISPSHMFSQSHSFNKSMNLERMIGGTIKQMIESDLDQNMNYNNYKQSSNYQPEQLKQIMPPTNPIINKPIKQVSQKVKADKPITQLSTPNINNKHSIEQLSDGKWITSNLSDGGIQTILNDIDLDKIIEKSIKI